MSITSNDFHHSSNNLGGGGWHTVSMDQAARSQTWRKVLVWSGTRTIRRQAPAGRPLEGLGVCEVCERSSGASWLESRLFVVQL